MSPPARAKACLEKMSALLRQNVSTLHSWSADETLVDRISTQMLFQLGNRPSVSESRSWSNSLSELFSLLAECDLGELTALIEYQLPYSSKRVDVVLVGTHPRTSQPTVLIVELKQWTDAESLIGSEDLLRIPTYGGAGVLHPLAQVANYRDYLLDFNRFLSANETNVIGFAYLHNWLKPRNDALNQITESNHLRMFTGAERNLLREFIVRTISTRNSEAVTDDLLAAKLAPTKQLLALAADEIRNREQFHLLDEQQVAYSTVMRSIKEADASNLKTAVIVTGGPGSGKSVIALSLLGELSRRGRTCLHATGSRAFRNSLRKIAGARAPKIQKMFSYFNSFMTSEKNSLDVIICDEAHRIRETSANRYTKAEFRTGTPQVHELLNVARVPVFLLDSNQVVRRGENGTPEYIESAAHELGIRTIRIDLEGQYRCGGSKLYENWILGLLQIQGEDQFSWENDESFKVELVSSPMEMEEKLKQVNEDGHKGRITAGYCWPWRDPNPDGTLPDDVVIGDWKRPWNVKSDRGVGEYLSGELWAIDPKGFDQVGCVYTVQGFEYDWNGVIMGPDLVWRNDKWVANPSGSSDPAMRGVDQSSFETLIKNTYKVLLTRGLVGTYIYSVDPETQEHFQDLFTK